MKLRNGTVFRSTGTGARFAVDMIRYATFGMACGIVLFFGEATVGFFAGDHVFFTHLLLLPVFYVLLGLMLGGISWLLAQAAGLVRTKALTAGPPSHVAMAIIPISVLFTQGLIVVHTVILKGAAFYSLVSIAFSAFWLTLCSALALLHLRSLKSQAAYPVSKSLLGLLLSAAAVALLYVSLEEPDAGDYVGALVQVLLLFGCVLCFYIAMHLPQVAKRMAARNVRSKRILGRILGVSGIVLVAALVVAQMLEHRRTKALSVQVASPRDRMPNIILIVVDTLRADHLSCYGYEATTSPVLDEFAASAIRFEKCYSPTNWTVPGHASLFTGRFPISHGAHAPGGKSLENGGTSALSFPLPDDELTLAESLAENGYQTAAVVANKLISSGRRFGLDQGFDYWHTPRSHRCLAITDAILSASPLSFRRWHDERAIVGSRRASIINEMALRWIEERATRPFFLFINYMDCHSPYRPAPPFDRRFTKQTVNQSCDAKELRRNYETITPQQRQYVVSQYDGAIAYVDHCLGQLLHELRSSGLYDDSIIIITSDHGEYLGEHSLYTHGIGLYEPVIRVPLILKPHASFVQQLDPSPPVQLIDIMPTVLTMLGIAIPENVQGSSLTGRIMHPVVAEDYCDATQLKWFDGRFSEDSVAIIDNADKLIVRNSEQNELYNLARDPGELHNEIDEYGDRARILAGKLTEWSSDIDVKARDTSNLPDVDEETQMNLEALGYM